MCTSGNNSSLPGIVPSASVHIRLRVPRCRGQGLVGGVWGTWLLTPRPGAGTELCDWGPAWLDESPQLLTAQDSWAAGQLLLTSSFSGQKSHHDSNKALNLSATVGSSRIMQNVHTVSFPSFCISWVFAVTPAQFWGHSGGCCSVFSPLLQLRILGQLWGHNSPVSRQLVGGGCCSNL